MKSLKLILLVALAAMLASVVAGSAMATSVTPAGTAVTATSSNSTLTVNGQTITCTTGSAAGTTPTGTATTLTSTVNLAWSGCTAFGFIGATVSPCNGNQQGVMNNAGAITVHLVTNCSITVTTGSCVTTIPSGSIFNGTGANNATNSTESFTNVAIPGVTSNGVFPCPPAGTYTGTYNASGASAYTFAKTAADGPNVTVNP